MDYDLLLIRKWFTNRSTVGEFFFSEDLSTRACYILEDEARPADVKIPHFTCIPPGDYMIRLTMSNRFKRVMPLIYNVAYEDIEGVKNWNIIRHGKVIYTGVRMHIGNIDANTDACQLPGLTRTRDRVFNSEDAFNPIYNKMYDKIGTNGILKYRIIHDQIEDAF